MFNRILTDGQKTMEIKKCINKKIDPGLRGRDIKTAALLRLWTDKQGLMVQGLDIRLFKPCE